ncbi:MAG TPA: DUF1257 domain-containing protein [Thermoguttaceae bacterium]|nr:DUF1257 domain-containing protein [Thermoguttaceae bacterium]
MSSVLVLTPIIIANWPAITAVVTAAVATMGFSAVQAAETQQTQMAGTTREEIEVDNSEILENAGGRGEELVVEREGLRAVFTRDGRGVLRVCMEGKGHSKAELRKIGQELVDRVTQQYVYHRVMTEMKQRNMHVVSEEVAEDRTVKIRVRNW